MSDDTARQASSRQEVIERRLRLLEPGRLFAGSVFRDLLQRRFALVELSPGETVGVFTIVREIARGGMGIVYLAARADGEYEQTVALKWLPDSVHDENSAELFRHERQIVANLRHPAIARLIEGGRTSSGHLWFAMEYVDGFPIDEHVVIRGLGLRARIELLLGVLDAVAFAHGKLLIHRDIKPSNVMIDADGQPRLLDFGIAALIDGPPTAVAYSPGFASPEQIAAGEVGVASDIWQLGRLCEIVLNAGDTGTPARRIADDLLAIIAKAKAPDPTHRYSTVAEMQTDMRRFLSHRAVSARRPGLWHRGVLAIRRHPFVVTASTTAIAAFLATVVSFTIEVRRERDQAERARDTTQTVSDFITKDILSAADPSSGGRSDVSLAAVVEQAVDKVDKRFPQRPEVQGLLNMELGRILSNLGRQELAASTLAKATANLQSALGTHAAATLEARYLSAKVAQRNLRNDTVDTLYLPLRADAVLAGQAFLVKRIDVALAWNQAQRGEFRACYDAYSRLLQADDENDEASHRVRLYTGLGYCANGQGLAEVALTHAEQGRDLGLRLLGEYHPQTLDMFWIQSMAQTSLGRFDEAVASAERAFDGTRHIKGDDHVSVAAMANQVGMAHLCAGRTEPALNWLNRGLAIRLNVLGADDARVAGSKSALGFALLRSGRLDEAETTLADAMRILDLTPEWHDVSRSALLGTRAQLHLIRGDIAAAEQDYRVALQIAQKRHGEVSRKVAALRIGLGLSLLRGPRHTEGYALIDTALPLMLRAPSCHADLVQQAQVALGGRTSGTPAH